MSIPQIVLIVLIAIGAFMVIALSIGSITGLKKIEHARNNLDNDIVSRHFKNFIKPFEGKLFILEPSAYLFSEKDFRRIETETDYIDILGTIRNTQRFVAHHDFWKNDVGNYYFMLIGSKVATTFIHPSNGTCSHAQRHVFLKILVHDKIYYKEFILDLNDYQLMTCVDRDWQNILRAGISGPKLTDPQNLHHVKIMSIDEKHIL